MFAKVRLKTTPVHAVAAVVKTGGGRFIPVLTLYLDTSRRSAIT